MLTKTKDTDEEKIQELTIVDLVKSDTAVYQCNASNEYSYVFKDFFLNVLLLPPDFIVRPDREIKAKPGSDVTLKCSAHGAPKPTIKWYELPSHNLIESDDRKYVLKNGYLTIYNLTGDDSKRYKCEARNRFGMVDYESKVIVEEIKNESGIIVAPTGMGIRDGTQPFAKTDWFIGMICAIALVIILAILVCIVKRNRGGNYSVHEKEAALRKDFDREDGGFDEYSKPIYPTSGAPVGSRTSLTSSLKHGDDRDADSMTDYGEDDSSKFGEDGSFIGLYGPNNQRKQSGQSSTGVATFV
ncbi:neuroglian-like protein [Leptotrombidium deliense]|uniref:protein-tyrosine-phosphatase n=1 Tax=Leptotrombidium deliense TaxID=299467 RepID=A0A443SAV1_9ACAR|nr:neuroglian-like protein [Leptotrombidium deliense]